MEHSAVDEAVGAAPAQRWCALSLLHSTIEAHIEQALQSAHDLSVREFSVISALSERPDAKMRMSELSEAVVLSQSATTRVVGRLESRGVLQRVICDTDRRGIYTAVTAAGHRLLAQARPTNDTALDEVLRTAEEDPRLAFLVDALRRQDPAA
ncbi:MarR family winged helix-turn-helix transcriptional regulator [Streptomonospora salina]|uniref:DNA-binding MarR family transcriptional regulator n=1 Tax=Streptomonospora salina TaxID=104205 RepID=A0A841E6W3_9ACTN|nr:MarR family transcriptional regulator [Streptomonospora salina]MBB5998572.1 DNA-binding MarR family transcriptional regulator [Streptomonospora salina]